VLSSVHLVHVTCNCHLSGHVKCVGGPWSLAQAQCVPIRVRLFASRIRNVAYLAMTGVGLKMLSQSKNVDGHSGLLLQFIRFK